MFFSNNWSDIAENMDDTYDTFEEIIIPNIYNIFEEEFYYDEVINIKKNIDNYCIDEYYNMEFKNVCDECFLHEPQCVCV